MPFCRGVAMAVVAETITEAPAPIEDTTDEVTEETTGNIDRNAEGDATNDRNGEVVDGAVLGEEEWYAVVWVPPGSLIIGRNVRQENAVPGKAGVRDVKKRGVRAPILAYRDESGDLVV